jgi:hypothetical protein
MTFCQVCFVGADTVFVDSMNAGIGVLLGVTAIVLGCFARFFVALARRSRENAHLVGGPEPYRDRTFDASFRGSVPGK